MVVCTFRLFYKELKTVAQCFRYISVEIVYGIRSEKIANMGNSPRR